MNHYKIGNPQIERTLTPCYALALGLLRRYAEINRYQAEIDHGHGSLTQRVSDLKDMGFVIHAEYKPYIDLQGKEHKRVAHYTYLGWVDPATQTAA